MNFYNTYTNDISPVQSLDILIKSGEDNIEPNEICSILNISQKEMNYIVKEKNIKHISSESIPVIMLNGSSYICRLFRKSLSYAKNSVYTPEDIAYIYSIDRGKVINACNKLHITEITEDILPKIFKNIRVGVPSQE